MSRQNRKSQPVEELLVSVIIPTYGRPDRLSQLLAQLSVQETDSFNYEIIVVDDGSPEPVGAIVQAASNQTKAPVRYLRQENRGPAAARNFGAQTACGEYLLF